MEASDIPKKRLKAAESRRALLNAGRELLKVRGVAPGLDRVTLKEAIEISGVPRSTAYRLYEGGRGQLEEFRADLLTDLGRPTDPSGTVAVMQTVMEENSPAIESQDPVQMAAVLREMVRQGVEANVQAWNASLEWHLAMSTLASTGTGSAADRSLLEVLEQTSREWGLAYTDFLLQSLPTFGLRMIDPISREDFGAMCASSIEGACLHANVVPSIANITRRTGPNGEAQSWNAAAITVESLILSLTEPDPASITSADLRSWSSF